jgi:hypothetical protein
MHWNVMSQAKWEVGPIQRFSQKELVTEERMILKWGLSTYLQFPSQDLKTPCKGTCKYEDRFFLIA